MDLADVQRLYDDWGASRGRLAHVEDEFNPRSGWLDCTYYVTI